MQEPKPPVYVETATGNIINLADNVYGNLTVEDIVEGLARIERFNGRAQETITVLQHSYAMYMYAKDCMGYNDEYCLLVLLHDAHEALLGDSVTPLKQLVPEIKKVEAMVQERILRRFKFDINKAHNVGQGISDIDQMACHIEYAFYITDIVNSIKGKQQYERNAEYYGFNPADRDTQGYRMYASLITIVQGMSTQDLINSVNLILYRHLATYGE